jgi:hypothetical protein
VPDCVLVAVSGLQPYLKCKMSDGSGEAWKVDLPTANPEEKYICTTADGYVAGRSYAHELNDWVKANCKGVR